MMIADYLKPKEPSSLEDEIKYTERDRLIHQQKVNSQADKLVHDIHREITAPGSLILACGIGFIMGELSKRRAPKTHDTHKTSPLKTTMSLMSSAQALYSALPLTWLIKTFYKKNISGRQAHPGKTSERIPKSGDRRRRPAVPPVKT